MDEQLFLHACKKNVELSYENKQLREKVDQLGPANINLTLERVTLEVINSNLEAQIAELTRRLQHSQAMFAAVQPLVAAVGKLPIQETIDALQALNGD